MHVVGTAGHVDHGKSTLVRALTGINPDRLKEEKEREMTIDLGFAWMKPGEGEDEIGIVDVPGHQDFIENMLAGIGGIDLAILVIAADEGVMPQTQEHLSILDLLQVKSGIVALTKVDLIDDPEWLDLVTLDISEVLAETVLSDAPIIPVSSVTGQGIDRLRISVLEQLSRTAKKPDEGYPRLSIDRVFSLTGFGTVVTGTLAGGRFRIGNLVEIQPTGRKARIRGLQTHKTKLQEVNPGSRVAMNLSGVDKGAIHRGDVVTSPARLSGTILCDVTYRHLPNAALPLKHNVEVKLFVGSAEVIARTRVLGAKQINPGQDGWLQLALRKQVALVRGDRFILRKPSPSATIGGGIILDPHPGRRHRRFQTNVIERLRVLSEGKPSDLLFQTIIRMQPATKVSVIQSSGLEISVASKAWSSLITSERVVEVDQYIMSLEWFTQSLDRLRSILDTFHQEYPLRTGMAREELRSRLQMPGQVFNLILEKATNLDYIEVLDIVVRRPGHRIVFDEGEQQLVDRLLDEMGKAGVNSPTVKEARTKIGDNLYFALLDLGMLQQVSPEVVYTTSDYEEIVGRIRQYLFEYKRTNAAQVRDLLHTSRKYAIALLEHLDDIGITKRIGDHREPVEKKITER